MMFLPMILMMCAGFGILCLWDGVKRDEASARYHEEVEKIMAGEDRIVVYGSYRAKSGYYDIDRKCC